MFWQQGLKLSEALGWDLGIWMGKGQWRKDEEQEEGDEPGLSQVSCVGLSAIHMTTDITYI